MSTPNPTTELWDSVLKAAILGTSRQSLAETKNKAEAGENAVSQLVAQLDSSSPETALLGAAAILVLHRRAGEMPPLAGEVTTQSCPLDESPRCSAAASTRLAGLLEQTESALFSEWIQAATARGLRVPEALLPQLLDVGKRQTALRPFIAGVLGRRGHWLAAQNSAWSYAVMVSEEQSQNDEIWQIGSKAERLSFLKLCRERDANQARELLASTWKQELSDERVKFIATFDVELSMADEEFLENVLDDTRKEVRQTAVDLLTQLPESRLVARQFERLKTILKLTSAGKLKGLLGRGSKIEIELPKEFEKAMTRDGIKERWHGGVEKGPKASWVQQMLGMVPPTFWEREWNMGAREIIRAVGASEWKDILLHGFIKAASRHKTMEWLEILNEEMKEGQSYFDAQILLSLPDESMERFLMSHLKTGALQQKIDSRFSQALHYYRKPWSWEFSRYFLGVAHEVVKSSDSQQYWLRYSLKSCAFWISPELCDEAVTGWPQQSPHWENWEPVVNDFLEILQTRRDMLRELDESATN